METSNKLAQTLTVRRSTERHGTFARKIDDQRQPIFLYTDAVIAAGDFHTPFHDAELLQTLYDTAAERGIKTLVVGGDLWDVDSLSAHLKLVHIMDGFEIECGHVRALMTDLYNHFDHIYVCTGNHEMRWMKASDGKLDIKQLWKNGVPENMTWNKFVRKVHITLDDHIHMYQGDQDWLLVHPKSYSQLPLSVTTRLAMKHLCHIVGFHGHQYAHGWDKSGHFRVIDGGGLFDKYSLDYQRGTSAMPEMKSGFNTIVDNVVVGTEGR